MTRPGIEVLAAQGFAPLHGLRVGLVTNPTGIRTDGKTTTIDALHHAPGVTLAALFGPEHGVRGDVPAGRYIASYADSHTGIPVYSLYGPTKTPTAPMLKGLDVLVFDLQDIGCRSYTYLSTLGAVLDGAIRHGVPVIVCDRPNPLGGRRVEGGLPHTGFESFISRYAVSYRHGLTLGEAAKFLVGQGLVGHGKRADLTVIPCADLTRSQAGWDSFGGLPWIPTSPNIPTPEAAVLYAVTGITGELPALSIGIGTDAPFGYCGAPGVDGRHFADTMRSFGLKGIDCATATWTPRKGNFAGRACSGVRIRVSDIQTAALCRVNFALLAALRTAAPEIRPFARVELFDFSCGTSAVRRAFLAGASEPDLWETFDRGADAFAARRQPYLLYS